MTIPIVPSKSPVRLDPLDLDPLVVLERQEKRLTALLYAVVKYRTLLHEQVRQLRVGADPRLVRAGVEQLDYLRRDLKKWARQV